MSIPFNPDIIREAMTSDAGFEYYRLDVEMMGDPAFDFIAQSLDVLSSNNEQVARGLELLTFLARQFCANRQRELLNIASRYLSYSDRAVRTAAVFATTAAAFWCDYYKTREERAELREQLRPLLKIACELGVDEEARGEIEEYLTLRKQSD